MQNNKENAAIINYAIKALRNRELTNNAKELRKYAQKLNVSDFDRYWIFLYEILSENDLIEDWKAMKKNNVTFLAI